MNARFRFSIVALCVAGVLAGCGSVTNGLAFQAPSGWTGTPAMFGRLQMWIKAGKQKNMTQMVMLVKTDASKNADLSVVPPQYSKDMKIVERGSTKLCGTQPADQFIADGTSSDGKRSRVEMVSTVIDKDRYVAVYIRPASMAADKMAEAAIHSLCPVK